MVSRLFGKREGPSRVFHSSITVKQDGMLHTLSKCQLSLVTIFVFNVPRSFKVEDVPYNIFEEIKDGRSLSTKYDSKQLRFNVPNVVLVFANDEPLIGKMSLDRWKVFNILGDELGDIPAFRIRDSQIAREAVVKQRRRESGY